VRSRHAGASKAAFAAFTARFTSSALPRGTCAQTLPENGSVESIHSPPAGSTHSLLMNNW
jgi:hypothetical protein